MKLNNLNAILLNTIKMTLVFLVMNEAVYGQDDPCSEESNKIDCIVELIEQEKEAIENKINYLNTTPGPQGERGIQGPQGMVGNEGLAGEDRRNPILSQVEVLLEQMDERDIEIGRLNRNEIDPIINFFDTNIYDLRRRFSNLNRNPEIIGESSTDRISTLDFPRGDGLGSPYLSGFDVYRNGELCQVRLVHNVVNTSCETATDEGQLELVNVCTNGVNSANYCGEVISNRKMNAIVISDQMLVDSDELLNLPQQESLHVLSSTHEWPSYKMGMEANDPLFDLALENVLTKLENPEIRDEIYGLYENARSNTSVYYHLYRTQLATDPQYIGQPDELEEAILASMNEETEVIASIDFSIELFETLENMNYGMRKERLAEYAKSSDLLYYALVHSIAEVYLNYLYDPSFAASLTNDELEALQGFEENLLAFSQNVLQQWKDIAQQKRDELSVAQPTLSMAHIFESQQTEDVVSAAALELQQRYRSTSQSVTQLESFAASTGVSIGLSAPFASGLIATTSIGAAISGAGTTTGFGVGAFLSGGGMTAVGGIVGVVGVVAFPATVVVLAVTALVVQSIEIGRQESREARYEALQEFEISSLDFLQYFPNREAITTNLIHWWLMGETNRGFSQ